MLGEGLCKSDGNFQVSDLSPDLVLDTKNNIVVALVPMARDTKVKSPEYKVPKQVQFRPDEREIRIIQAGQRKHGLKKAQDIISMALMRFAEHEQIELAS